MPEQYAIAPEALRIDAEMKAVWEKIPVGQTLGPVTYEVSRAAVDRYLDAVEGPEAPAGTLEFVPPDLFCGDYGPLTAGFEQTVGFHASHTFTSVRPLAVGAVVSTSGKVVEKFTRRGFRYYTVEFTHRDPADVVVAHNQTTIAVGVMRDPRYVPEPSTPQQATPPPDSHYEEIERTCLTQDRMGLFAAQGAFRWGWDETGGGAHTDEEFAHAAGLDETNAQSLHYVGWLGRHLALRWGREFWERGRVEVKFMGQVGPDDELLLEFALAGPEALQLRVSNLTKGSMVCLGKAWLVGEAR